MVADDHDLVSVVEPLELPRKLRHRQVDTAVDMTDFEFPGLAHVEQQRVGIGEIFGQLRRIHSAHPRRLYLQAG